MERLSIQRIRNKYTGSTHYMPSFYLQFHIYAIEKWPFSVTYPLIYGGPWSFYIVTKNFLRS